MAMFVTLVAGATFTPLVVSACSTTTAENDLTKAVIDNQTWFYQELGLRFAGYLPSQIDKMPVLSPTQNFGFQTVVSNVQNDDKGGTKSFELTASRSDNKQVKQTIVLENLLTIDKQTSENRGLSPENLIKDFNRTSGKFTTIGFFNPDWNEDGKWPPQKISEFLALESPTLYDRHSKQLWKTYNGQPPADQNVSMTIDRTYQQMHYGKLINQVGAFVTLSDDKGNQSQSYRFWLGSSSFKSDYNNLHTEADLIEWSTKIPLVSVFKDKNKKKVNFNNLDLDQIKANLKLNPKETTLPIKWEPVEIVESNKSLGSITFKIKVNWAKPDNNSGFLPPTNQADIETTLTIYGFENEVV